MYKRQMLTDVEDLPRINELAQSLQELKASGQLTKFKAVVSATKCESLDDVFDRLEKLPQYCFETKIRDSDALVLSLIHIYHPVISCESARTHPSFLSGKQRIER